MSERKLTNLIKTTCWGSFLVKQGPNPLSSKPFWKRINRFRNKPYRGIPTLFNQTIELKTDEEKALAFGNKLLDTFNINPNDESIFNSANKIKIKNYIENEEYKRIFSIILLFKKLFLMLKESRITMIEKKVDKSDIKNYRPTICTAIFSKLFEKVIDQRRSSS